MVGVSPIPAVVVEAVRQAVQEIFGSICGAEPVLVPGESPVDPGSCVVGIISYTGGTTWSFALIIPEETAEPLAAKFAGFDIPFASSDMGDVVGELANVIAGDITARLEARGVAAQLSLPTVTRGSDLELLLPSGAACMNLGYDTAQGPLVFRLTAARPGVQLCRRPGSWQTLQI
jgi:CheY-specific phosphatase CheX